MFIGRTFEVEVYPFYFKEYIDYFKYSDIDATFNNYVMEGGMSGSYLYNSIERKKDEKLMSSLNNIKHEDYQYEGIQIYDIANWLMK